MMATVSVVAVNYQRLLVLCEDGETYPIVEWFDGDGEETDPEHAVFFLAGTEGFWFTAETADFEPVMAQ